MTELKPIRKITEEAPQLERRLMVLEAKLAAIQEALEALLNRLAEIEKAEAVREEAGFEPAEKPAAVAPPDIVAEIPVLSDDTRPLNWLRGRLSEERDMGNLNFREIEKRNAVELSIWFSPGMSGSDKLRVRRWITWCRSRMGEKAKGAKR